MVIFPHRRVSDIVPLQSTLQANRGAKSAECRIEEAKRAREVSKFPRSAVLPDSWARVVPFFVWNFTGKIYDYQAANARVGARHRFSGHCFRLEVELRRVLSIRLPSFVASWSWDADSTGG